MLLTNEQNSNRNKLTVVAFPAQTPILGKNEIFFLFSVRQILSVLDPSDIVLPADNSNPSRGTAEWRGKQFPILSLEKSLGLPVSKTVSKYRIIAIREVYKSSKNNFQDVHALCQIGTTLRRWQLPIECQPIEAPRWISQPSFLKGVYRMEKSVFLVPHLKEIVTKTKFNRTEVVHSG